MEALIRTHVRDRAGNRCEYCQLHQDDSPLATLHIEHIAPRIHGGTDALDNLALACIDCNLHKGTNLTGVDPETRQVTRLFHPREKNGATISSGAAFELSGAPMSDAPQSGHCR